MKDVDKQKTLSRHQKAEVKVARALAEKLGLRVVFYSSKMDAEGNFKGDHGYYSKSKNTVYLDINAGRRNISDSMETAILATLSHELTHQIRVQSPALYAELQKAVLEELNGINAAALQKTVNDAMSKDSTLTAEDALEEVVANACEDMLRNDAALRSLLENHKTLGEKIKTFITEFLNDIKNLLKDLSSNQEISEESALLRSSQEAYNRIAELWAKGLLDASEAGQYKSESEEKTQSKKHKLRGVAEDGKKIYESNFPKGTPKAAKSQRILDYIQNVWSKKPITLVISNGETSREILAQFDPFLDKGQNIASDAAKIAGGNRHGTHSEQRVTLDLADDYYEIASESKYNYSKAESGKASATHKDVKQWHYFVNDIYFSEQGEDSYTPYTVTINVKEKENGNFVYNFSAEKKEASTRRTLHADVNTYKGANGELFISSIPQNPENVNPSSENSSEESFDTDVKRRARDNSDEILVYRSMLSELEAKAETAEERKQISEWRKSVDTLEDLSTRQTEAEAALKDKIPDVWESYQAKKNLLALEKQYQKGLKSEIEALQKENSSENREKLKTLMQDREESFQKSEALEKDLLKLKHENSDISKYEDLSKKFSKVRSTLSSLRKTDPIGAVLSQLRSEIDFVAKKEQMDQRNAATKARLEARLSEQKKRYQEMARKRMENRKIAETMNDTAKICDRLTSMLKNPTAARHVPEKMLNAIVNLVDRANQIFAALRESKVQTRMRELDEAREKLPSAVPKGRQAPKTVTKGIA